MISFEHSGKEIAQIERRRRIFRELRQGFSKNDVKRWLRSSLKQQRNEKEEEQMLEGSVRLASRLLTMTDIGPVPYGIQGSPSMDWVDGATSLKEFLATYFQESQPEKEVRFKFEQAFNAYNLRRYTGVEIVWTDNLADHLRLMDDDARLCVFSHVAFLRNQNSGLFPHGLIDETLRTLALLFPRNDMRTKKWLQVLVSRGEKSLDPELMKCRRLKSNERRAESFRFWHDELLALQEKFEEPAPTSITQLWYDRRVKAQWYTFWIAVSVLCLTIFFGTVQSIEGALQVYKAYHPAADSHGSNLGTKYEKP
ncbi:hypothetical protein EJ04DRAFT_534787 [Polyplosphaeria fusca]|uniref:Uncharacterized protein n=1 Tax=Polyplosphaeria fusca TaxID=682080 RepID=A0A9P4QZY8_9PLEO|nr:hypothetical protein EJ04DRAFT_534787 [Polyplosphaeria fusca]